MRKSTQTPEYRKLCKMLVEVREKAGLSQRALAERLDVPHSWVSKVETGERRIDLIEFGWFLTACQTDASTTIANLLKQISPASKRGRSRAR